MNIALTGFGEGCTIAWDATASDGTFPGSEVVVAPVGAGPGKEEAGTAQTATYNVYPVIHFGPTAVTAANGAWLCTQNPVNGPGSAVNTGYEPCTTPGDCIGGPCVTTQNGAFIPCEGSFSFECNDRGVTVTFHQTNLVTEPDTYETISYEVYLFADTIFNGQPTYTASLMLDIGEEINVAIGYTGTEWEFWISSGTDSDLQASAPALTGPWTPNGDTGFDTIEVACSNLADYACVSWQDGLDADGNANMVRIDMFPITYTVPGGGFSGWGTPDEANQLVVDEGQSTWRLRAPDNFEVDTGVASSNPAPWGSYTTSWVGVAPAPTPSTYDVEVSPGLCPRAASAGAAAAEREP